MARDLLGFSGFDIERVEFEPGFLCVVIGENNAGNRGGVQSSPVRNGRLTQQLLRDLSDNCEPRLVTPSCSGSYPPQTLDTESNKINYL